MKWAAWLVKKAKSVYQQYLKVIIIILHTVIKATKIHQEKLLERVSLSVTGSL